MAGSLSAINVIFRVDLSSLSTGMQNAARDLRKYGDSLQTIGRSMSLYITAPVVAAGAATIKMASDYEESLNKVNVAFDESSAVVRQFAKDTLKNFGIAEGSALDMAALFGDMATSMGLTRPAAAQMSTALVGLAGDLASFKNMRLDEVTTALNGVFTGETESLKRLGIVMTETNLSAFALSKGITKNLKDFTQAEKVQLRYNYVMANTTNAQGDFVRTGGGAANQMRVFQEGLKELGVQFGQIVLPAFTSLIVKLNDAVAWFKELSPEVKTTILYVGGLAAAIGPLGYVVGGFMKNLANLMPLVNAGLQLVGNGFIQLGKAIALAQAYAVPLAVVLGGLYLGYKLYASNVNTLTEAQQKQQRAQETLNQVDVEAAKLIVDRKTKLNSLLAVVRDETKTIQQRRDVVKEINAISPEYLGNLTAETINTDAARAAIERYNVALLQSAKAKAADSLLSQNQQKQIEAQAKYELKLAQAGADLETTLADKNRSVTDQARAFTKENTRLRYVAKQELEATLKPLREEEAVLKKIFDRYKSQLGLLAGVDLQGGEMQIGGDDAAKAGTIKYFQELIDTLKKQQDEVATTSDAYTALQEKIDGYQKKIDAIQGKRVKVQTIFEVAGVKNPFEGAAPLPELKTPEGYDAHIAKLKELQETVATTSATFNTLEYAIAQLELEKEVKFDLPVDQVNNYSETFRNFGQNFKETSDNIQRDAERMKAIAEGVSVGFSNAFESMSGRFLDSLGAANDGLQGFFKGMASVITKIISAFLAQAISAAISGASLSAALAGPGAFFLAPAFIAEAVSGVVAAFAAIPKFESGGIVGGNSFSGDRLLVRVNSGEMILNQAQQQNLWGAVQGAALQNNVVPIIIDSVIEGDKIRLVLGRTDARNNRLG